MPSLDISLLTIALCLSAGFQQGYIASVLNQPYIHIEQFVNETITQRFGTEPSENVLNMIWSTLNIMFPIAAIIGQFLAAWMCKRLGRKNTALVTCALYIPGVLLSSLSFPSSSFELLFLGRLIWSLANGINTVNATVWIVECAPESIRGRAAALQEFSMAIGSLLCQTIGIPFSTSDGWYLVFLPNLPIVVVAAVLFCLVPDSPTSILERGGDSATARAALARYYDVPVESTLVDEELGTAKGKKTKKNEGQQGILWIFNPFSLEDDKARVVRQAAWLGVVVKIAYVFTGARCLRSYSTFVLHSLSHFPFHRSLYGSFLISLLRLPATLVPVFFVDRFGRRPLILVSLGVSLLALVSIIASIKIGMVLQLVSFVSFAVLLLINAAGLGSVSRFYAAELVPRSLLLNAVSVLAGIEAFAKIIVELSFFPVAAVVGVNSLFVFLLPTCIFFFVIWAMCPETSNRSVYQVLNDIAHRKNLKVDFSVQS